MTGLRYAQWYSLQQHAQFPQWIKAKKVHAARLRLFAVQ